MPSTYSPNLRLELIGSGEQQNVWGNSTNNNLGTLIENAISGYVEIRMPDANYTLTALDGANDEARSMSLWLAPFFTLTAPRNLIAPAVPKVYIIANATDGGFAVGISSGGGSLGVYIPNGTTRVVFCNGVDFFYAGAYELEVLTRAGTIAEVGLK